LYNDLVASVIGPETLALASAGFSGPKLYLPKNALRTMSDSLSVTAR
jgi:hypothetical protein